MSEFLAGLDRNMVVEGDVSAILPFGVFVALDGAPGPVAALVRIPQISWERIDHPGDVLAVGDRVRALVLHVDLEREQVSLSIRALLPEPPPREKTGSEVLLEMQVEALRRKLLES
ncbi:S1 RNA-binding domain-containing protein [Lentzea sp. DG1S-22]|uniref:S1 RNA-binding domain-containing protein n=1 Tax=Lentzea sp. DG1S-22 TaxID=3108822 RepID=UPI002E7A4F81|nr:S1 RNA-binding domain-containing protein [Lentzea sp. DG1S-22]WVH77259.1 S1 RNA-binding domain-containing protein [Lentzea sp. DG1S-22]